MDKNRRWALLRPSIDTLLKKTHIHVHTCIHVFALSSQTRTQTTACVTFTQPRFSQSLDVFTERLHDKVVRTSEEQPKKFQAPQKRQNTPNSGSEVTPELLENDSIFEKKKTSSVFRVLHNEISLSEQLFPQHFCLHGFVRRGRGDLA